MTECPYRAGQFVWCAFPQSETPLHPGPEHVAYVMAVSGHPTGFTSRVAYTSSQPWVGAVPPGVRIFNLAQAIEMGQDKPFVLQQRRVAHLPVTPQWFPRLAHDGQGILGAAPEALQKALLREAVDFFRRRSELVEHLGPRRPGERQS